MKWQINNLVLSAVLLSLMSCSSTPERKGDATNARIKTELESASQASAIKNTGLPDEVAKALLPPIRLDFPSEMSTRLEPRFDISVKNANVKDVFMNLVEGTAYSVTIDPDITGKVTLQLRNVSLHEAFDVLRKNYGYDVERENNQFYVYGSEIRSRVFTVNAINFTRSGKSSTKVSSGGIGDSGNGVNVETEQTVDFWKILGDGLKSLVGEDNGRQVVLNAPAGLIIVRATAKELRMVDEYLQAVHNSLARQVVLETKILEVELNDSFQSGVNWTQLLSSSSQQANLSAAQIGGGTLISGSGVSNIAGKEVNGLATGNIANGVTSAFGGMFSMALNVSKFGNFGAFVELLKTQGDVHVLSSPRVSTVNNQKAVIKVGGDEYYVTGITSSQQLNASGAAASNTPQIELESFFSGISLDVTPQIDGEENITLHLHPTVSEVLQRNKSFVVEGRTFDLPLAKSTIRESDNIVRAKNNQVIIVGGLMKEGTTDEEASVPLLGSLPLIGYLFKHKKVVNVKRELVIMVKPTIVESNGYWSADASRSLSRVADFRR